MYSSKEVNVKGARNRKACGTFGSMSISFTIISGKVCKKLLIAVDKKKKMFMLVN